MSHCGTVKLHLKWLKPLFKTFFRDFFSCSNKFYHQAFSRTPQRTWTFTRSLRRSRCTACWSLAFIFFPLLPISDAGGKHLRAADSWRGRSGSSRGAAGGADGQALWEHGHRGATAKHRNSSQTPRRSEDSDINIAVSVSGSTAVPIQCNSSATHLQHSGCWSCIEDCILYPTAGPVPLSVYQRLKKLEDRILELEGLSPEYFQSTVSISVLKC